MIRVGAVNIDTSHPLGFGEVMQKDKRMHYVGVYNDSFRSDEEVEGFMKRFNVEKRCTSLDELAEMCDLGMVHGCNWDEHLRCAQAFWKKGKPVFIDKPLVGNLADCRKMQDAVKNGAVILGASSARYAYEIQSFLKIPIEERGDIVSVFGTAGVDEFNYGIHVVEAIGGLIGTGAQYVKYLGKGEADGKFSESYYLQFANGKSAVYNTFTGVWQPFVMTVMTTKSTYQFRMDSNRLYEALITELCNYMEGKPNLLVDINALAESVQIMLAGKASKSLNGECVELSSLTEKGPSYDGKIFWDSYSAASGPMYAL
ncbi:MAG: Gfo/Idh/MocA family oxidoreductase [Oscillospiraceae bacterium]